MINRSNLIKCALMHDFQSCRIKSVEDINLIKQLQATDENEEALDPIAWEIAEALKKKVFVHFEDAKNYADDDDKEWNSTYEWIAEVMGESIANTFLTNYMKEHLNQDPNDLTFTYLVVNQYINKILGKKAIIFYELGELIRDDAEILENLEEFEGSLEKTYYVKGYVFPIEWHFSWDGPEAYSSNQNSPYMAYTGDYDDEIIWTIDEIVED